MQSAAGLLIKLYAMLPQRGERLKVCSHLADFYANPIRLGWRQWFSLTSWNVCRLDWKMRLADALFIRCSTCPACKQRTVNIATQKQSPSTRQRCQRITINCPNLCPARSNHSVFWFSAARHDATGACFVGSVCRPQTSSFARFAYRVFREGRTKAWRVLKTRNYFILTLRRKCVVNNRN